MRKSSRLRVISADPHPKRSPLPRHEARRRYVRKGELVALETIKKDAELFDEREFAVGPFARVDANAVAAQEGKTRGAINNVFGSQSAFQAATMALTLSAGDWIDRLEYPDPGDFPDADAWVDALFTAESARGPQHATEPTVDYAFLWALWLSAVPYGLWSEHISRPSMEEHVQWVERLEQLCEQAIDHFGCSVRDGTSVNDLACAIASMTEGVWLNQCLTRRHPCEPGEPIATVLRRSGRLLWHGAIEPRGA